MNPVSLALKCTAEVIGTFVFLSVALLTGNPVLIGAALAGAIAFSASYSGGVLNPAASMALWLKGDLTTTHTAMYMLSQYVGAALAFSYYKLAPKNTPKFV
jgi:glycerol uptake facilitator-like aquaporin